MFTVIDRTRRIHVVVGLKRVMNQHVVWPDCNEILRSIKCPEATVLVPESAPESQPSGFATCPRRYRVHERSAFAPCGSTTKLYRVVTS
jgi:hypothetical protein